MKETFLDKAIGWYDPERGLKRTAARAGLANMRSLYDGATVGRRTGNWRTSNASANVAMRGALHLLRARSRDFMRNTWWGGRVVNITTAHAVGTGIMPVCKEAPAAATLWKEWGKTCDFEGQLNIDGLTALACKTVVGLGETLARFVPISTRSGRKVPLEIQLLEPDHLDPSRDRITFNMRGGANSAIVDQGIEYTPEGKRAAYWLFPEHPGARGLVATLTSLRIPASDVLHVYKKDMIGQGRGIPWLTPVILKGRDLADLEESILLKAKVEACFAAYRKVNDPATNLAQAKRQETNADGTRRTVESISPGTITTLLHGEEIGSIQPTGGMAFDSIMVNTWMALAAGAGLTYDQLTGDLRQANYSSLRAGKIEFRRLLEQFQWLTLAPMFLDQIWTKFIQVAVDAGALPYRNHGYPVEWIMPANEPIDPLKDLQADILAVRSGRMTWDNFVASWGFEPEAQLDQIAAWQEKLDKRNIVLDSDPRRTVNNIRGAQQNDTSGAFVENTPNDPNKGAKNDETDS
jgi:lambda family phage portal protein